MRLMFPFLAAVGVAVAASNVAMAEGPGFDCALAETPTEKAICASTDLSQKDRAISALYNDLRGVLLPANRDRLLDGQRMWLSRRNACGADLGCIAALSDQRIRELEGISRGEF